MAQYIRPILRKDRGCYSEPRSLSPEDLARILRSRPAPPRRERAWTPSIDYELIARNMHPDVQEAYIAKSKAWFDAHPPRTPPPPPASSTIDVEAAAALIAKYGTHAPLAEYRKVGYSEEAVEKIRARRVWYKEHDAELQAEIDRRWPGSSLKPKKVIKAVKKKMP